MKSITRSWFRASFWLFCSLFISTPVLAQVTVDGNTSTTVTSPDGNNFTINDGDRAGSNLFHSFQDFSVPNGGEAFFNNADAISNIFSRVTGGNISSIDGLIRANGSANLFLINPAGIIFGEGARLDIGGSFYGSTADSILFEDGEFSATDLDNPPLLTINAPIGLSFRDNPSTIEVNEQPEDSSLSASPHLALIGGEVSLDSGRVFGGNITLGGLAAAGTVNINDNGSLSFPDNVAQADVSLDNGSFLGIFGSQGNSIDLNANNVIFTGNSFAIVGTGNDINIQALDTLSLSDGSLIITQVSEELKGDAGNINIDASNVVLQDSDIQNEVLKNAEGNAGNINLNTNSLEARNSSSIGSRTLGQGDAGNITIDTTDFVSLSGESNIISNVDEPRENNNAIGNAGNISITTKELNLVEASISSTSFARGDAGDITIKDSERVVLDNSIISSNLNDLSSGNFDAIGDAGDINVTTQELTLTNESRFIANTSGMGTVGSIIIDANDVSLEQMSLILSQIRATARGEGGRIQINADNISLKEFSLLSTNTAVEATGVAGDIILDADTISITEGAIVDALTENDSNGGNITITARILELASGGKVVTSTDGDGDAGNINLSISDRIDLDGSDPLLDEPQFDEAILNQLQPNTGLFANTASADGGNIDIDTTFIIARPNQNSDILASAGEQGMGGRITIDAESVFGIQVRPQNNRTNDIDASGGVDGEIIINTPDVDVTQGLVETPQNVVEPEQTVAQACRSDYASRTGKDNGIAQRTGGLTIEGKGGVPPEPIEPLNSDNILVDGQVTNPSPQTQHPEIKPIKTSKGDIFPARGIVKTEDGRIILTAYPTNSNTNRIPHGSTNCS